ncbi:hypothetical protein [Acidihalobacter yilgarnensis]|uniref:hypothetical protein n=1 Tax=Acidihalobacter yilgarnensis TaxID=2819280 RepID=UPI0012EA1B76|nr:hypothetical protein [Acidihalobacter yilgarnensis]
MSANLNCAHNDRAALLDKQAGSINRHCEHDGPLNSIDNDRTNHMSKGMDSKRSEKKKPEKTLKEKKAQKLEKKKIKQRD